MCLTVQVSHLLKSTNLYFRRLWQFRYHTYSKSRNLYFRCLWQFRYHTYSKSTRSSVRCWRSVCWHFYKKYTLHSTISEEFLIYWILSFLLYWQGMYNVNRCLFVCLLTPLSTIFQLYRRGQFLLVEETGENHRPVASHDNLYHIMLHTSPWSRFELTASVAIVNQTTIRSRPGRPLMWIESLKSVC